jgi:hypothetical protein
MFFCEKKKKKKKKVILCTRFNVPRRAAVAETASESESDGDKATSTGTVVPGNRTCTVVIVLPESDQQIARFTVSKQRL